MTKHRKDFQKPTSPPTTAKGSHSGQGKLVYANTGEHGKATHNNPFTPSGVLAQWDGKQKDFETMHRSLFASRTVMDPQTGSRIKHACLRAPAIILAPIYVEADALATVCLIPE